MPLPSRRQRWIRWYRLASRQEVAHDVVLPARPTRRTRGIILHRFGLASFFALVVMVLFCVNYANNAGLICACLLALAWVCALLANHWMVSRIWLEQVLVLPGDEDMPGEVDLLWRLRAPVFPVCWLTIDGQVARLEFDDSGWARVRWRPHARSAGSFDFPTLHVSTSWPMSIGYSWFVMRPRAQVVVAPRRALGGASSGSEGEAQALAPATQGDPEGIRPRPPQDLSARWAWKPTLRQGRPITYEWAQSGNEVVSVIWQAQLPVQEAWRRMRGEIDTALSRGLAFQVAHPWGHGGVMRGERAALSVLCQVGAHALPPQPWGPGLPQAPGTWSRYWSRVKEVLRG
jgi:hypothetical protein